jgi:hypothetical protein
MILAQKAVWEQVLRHQIQDSRRERCLQTSFGALESMILARKAVSEHQNR